MTNSLSLSLSLSLPLIFFSLSRLFPSLLSPLFSLLSLCEFCVYCLSYIKLVSEHLGLFVLPCTNPLGHTTKTQCPHLLFQYSNHHMHVSIGPKQPYQYFNFLRPKHPAKNTQIPNPNTHRKSTTHHMPPIATTSPTLEPTASPNHWRLKKLSPSPDLLTNLHQRHSFFLVLRITTLSHWLAQPCKSTGNEYINDQHTQ